jgi:hypothetical protein
MNHIEYIKGKIDELMAMFPEIQIRYENHFISNTNLIEIDPIEFYENSEEFQKWEDETVFEFIDRFPDQTITFISKNAIVGIDKVDYEVSNNSSRIISCFVAPQYLQVPANFVSQVPSSVRWSYDKNIFISYPKSNFNILSDPSINFLENTEDWLYEDRINEPTSLIKVKHAFDTIEDNNSYRMAA